MGERKTGIVIRPIRAEDAGSLLALQMRCEAAAQWSEASYRDLEANSIKGWVALHDSTILGFVLSRAVQGEMEILNLAVDPSVRRSRIGSDLVARAIEEARQFGVKQVHLEVRESNSAARAFYLSAGFTEHGRRKNYYSQPVEDALLLVFHLH